MATVTDNVFEINLDNVPWEEYTLSGYETGTGSGATILKNDFGSLIFIIQSIH